MTRFLKNWCVRRCDSVVCCVAAACAPRRVSDVAPSQAVTMKGASAPDLVTPPAADRPTGQTEEANDKKAVEDVKAADIPARGATSSKARLGRGLLFLA